MKSILAFSLYALILLAPGWLVCLCAGLERNRLLLAFAFSYVVIVFTHVALRLLGGSVDYWPLVLLGVTLFLGVFSRRLFEKGHPTREKNRPEKEVWIKYESIGMWFVIVIFSAYHLLAGPYTEIPSDFWARLGHVTEQFQIIEYGSGLATVSLTEVFDDSVYVPFLHALIAAWIGVNPIELVTPATLATSLIFLCAFYCLVLRVQQKQKTNAVRKVAVGVLACAFLVLIFGVSSFSYVRYYAYFPHILNMALFFSALVVFMDVLEISEGRFKLLLLLGLFLLVTAIVNKQEAVFVVVMLTSISIVVLFQRAPLTKLHVRVLGIAVCFLASGFISQFLSADFLVGGNPHLLHLGGSGSSVSGWVVANPELGVWDTFGWFGVVVCLWLFLKRTEFAQMPYLWGGLLTPLLTVFNPLFVGIFVREIGWDPLWRFAFLVPVPFIAAILISSVFWSDPKRFRLIPKPQDIIFLILTLTLIFPVDLGWIENKESRIPSLLSVQNKNGALLWSDLITFLNSIEQKERIITDSVTNYVLTSATQHTGLARAKERWQKNDNYFRGDYRDQLEYYKRDDALLILNSRDGDLSETGRVSGHWPETILQISTSYPKDIVEYLDSLPERYVPIYELDGISVFRIQSIGQS